MGLAALRYFWKNRPESRSRHEIGAERKMTTIALEAGWKIEFDIQNDPSLESIVPRGRDFLEPVDAGKEAWNAVHKPNHRIRLLEKTLGRIPWIKNPSKELEQYPTDPSV